MACTTDDILAHKPEMWDVLVMLPPRDTRRTHDGAGVYPKLKDHTGKLVRATQRDLRRWTTLRRSVAHHANATGRPKSSGTAPTTASPSPFTLASSQVLNGPPSKSPRPSTASTNHVRNPAGDVPSPFADLAANEPSLGDQPDEVVEPQSWSALAYTSFLWWASAGEQRTDLDEEAAHDAELMADLTATPGFPSTGDETNEVAVDDEVEGDRDDGPGQVAPMSDGVEVGIIKYFHRLSSLMLSTLGTIIDTAEDGEDEGADDGLPPSRERYRDEPLMERDGEDGDESAPLLSDRSTPDADARPIHLGRVDLAALGLDVSSAADRTFLREMVALYWGREASVGRGQWVGGEPDGWQLCGLRVC